MRGDHSKSWSYKEEVFYLILFSCCSVAKSCPTLWNSTDWKTSDFSVLPISWSLFKFMSIESVMLSNHLILSSESVMLLNQLILSSYFSVFKNNISLKSRTNAKRDTTTSTNWKLYSNYLFKISTWVNIDLLCFTYKSVHFFNIFDLFL